MCAQISVIMPVYNKGKYIQKAIDSVLSQKGVEVELICVDDGSTDDSVSIIKRNMARSASVKLICQTNAGAGAARNTGITHSSADYLSFLDPDDWYPSNTVLSSLYERSVQSGCPVAMGKRLFYVKPFTLKRKDNLFSEGVHNVGELTSAFLYQSCLFRRDLIQGNKIEFPLYRRFQDPPFFLRVLSKADTFYFLNDYVHCYRRGVQRIAWNDEKLGDYLSGTQEALRLARDSGNNSIFDQVLESLNNASFSEGILESKSVVLFDKLCEIERFAEDVLGKDAVEIRALKIARSNNKLAKATSICSLHIENGVKSVF